MGGDILPVSCEATALLLRACLCVCVSTFTTKIFRNVVIGEFLTTLSAKVGRGAVHSGILAARLRTKMLPWSSTAKCKLSSPNTQ